MPVDSGTAYLVRTIPSSGRPKNGLQEQDGNISQVSCGVDIHYKDV